MLAIKIIPDRWWLLVEGVSQKEFFYCIIVVMKAVIIMGPQGSGKGTQADLLAKKLNLFHFDSGQYLRGILYDPESKKDKIIQRERKLNEAGKLNTPSWILKISSQVIKNTAVVKKGIVFSGSPRTFYEAFGREEGDKTKNIQGLMDVLNKYYGKKNISIILLNIPRSESIKRISGRFICSVCGSPLMASKNKYTTCSFCGGKVIKRKDDNKESVIERLKEYETRTKPILKEFKKEDYHVFEIDGTPAPYKIHQTILGKLKNV